MKRHLPVPRRSERPRQLRRPISALLMACAGMLLAACGGGGGGGTAGTTTISGSVFAAPVNGSSVTVKNASGLTVAGPVATAGDGTYSITLPDSALSGNLRFEAAAGAFIDEATGDNTVAGRLAAYVEAGSLGSAPAVHLTPGSTIVHDLVVSGKTCTDARSAFAAAFGFPDNTSVAPKNDNNVTGTDNVARRLAALHAVAFSLMTRDLGLGPDNQFLLMAAIAQDLSDNTLNGMNGASAVDVVTGSPLPEDIQNRFERAVDKAYDNTALNRTGLTADQIGTLPFSKLALTNSYRVQYIPGMMPPVQGKTQFKIRVANRSDNTAVTGLVASGSLNLVPWMHMATKSHSSPWDNTIVDNLDGTYSCTVYYLMSTAMGGTSMGYWRLAVEIGDPGGPETATFYPTVGMAMGTDTVRATLKGQNDNIVAAPAEQRTYYLFKDGAMTYDNVSTHTLNLFVAAKESMTSFPAVTVGTTLHDAGGAAWTVNDVSAEASTDNTFNTGVVNGENSGGGHWSFPGIAGLPRGSTGTVYVRLTVNGERKTTNGLAPSGANGYQAFSVTAP